MEDHLVCKQKPGNVHDTHAVAIKKITDGEIKIVGHIPRKISAICFAFMRRGGTILCHANGPHQYSSDLPQSGLEIPCVLKFIASNKKDTSKAKNQLESALNIEGEVTIGVVNQDSSQTSDLASADSATVRKVDDDASLTASNNAGVEKYDDMVEVTVDLTIHSESCSTDSPPPAKK